MLVARPPRSQTRSRRPRRGCSAPCRGSADPTARPPAWCSPAVAAGRCVRQARVAAPRAPRTARPRRACATPLSLRLSGGYGCDGNNPPPLTGRSTRLRRRSGPPGGRSTAHRSFKRPSSRFDAEGPGGSARRRRWATSLRGLSLQPSARRLESRRQGRARSSHTAVVSPGLALCFSAIALRVSVSRDFSRGAVCMTGVTT